MSCHQRRRPRPGRLAIAHSTTFGATPRDPPIAHVGTAPVPPSVAHWPHHISAAVPENLGHPNARAAPSFSTACMGHGTSRASLSDLRQYILTAACVRPVRRTGNKTSSSSWGRVTPSCFLTSWAFCETMPAHNESSPFRTNKPTTDVVRIGNASHTRISHADCTRPTA